MVTVVIGTQFGDEGKGKIVDYLSQNFDYVVRFHGGAGAGHTVENEYGRVALHLIPCGIFNKKNKCVIANGVMVDPQVLLEEIETLQKLGIKVRGRLLISPRAHVVHPYHKILDGILDEAKGDLKTATTRRGNGPVHADKVSYYGIQLHDLLNKDIFAKKLKTLIEVKKRIIKEFTKTNISFKDIFKEYINYGGRLRPYLADTFELLNKAVEKRNNILFEGAHGIFLDNDWGTYPYVTASSTLPSNIGAGAGVDPRKIDKVVGVVKAYSTRVDSGAGPLPTEIKGKLANSLREKGKEFGATTGRPRRIGWLDLVQIKFAVKLAGINELALTKADVLSGLNKIPVCIGYKYRGRSVDYLDLTAEKLKEVSPLYKNLEGWDSNSSKSFRRLMAFIENFVGVKIKIVSFGPDRNQTFLKSPL